MLLWQYTLIWAIRRETAAKIATLGHLQVRVHHTMIRDTADSTL
jgi:hypothetical protein